MPDDLVEGADHDDIAVLALGQVLGLEDDVERLIPGHVLQTQGDVTGHRIARHQVQIGEVGEQLEDRPDLDVLEVQRESLPVVDDLLTRETLLFGRGQRSQLQGEQLVRLVGHVLEVAAGLDIDLDVASFGPGLDRHDRCREVYDVEPTEQALRQGRVDDVDQDATPLLPHGDAGGYAREPDQDTALALWTAAEIDVANARPRGRASVGGGTIPRCGHRCPGLCSRGRGCRRRRPRRLRLAPGVDIHAHPIAFGRDPIGDRIVQVDYDTGAIACLHRDQAMDRTDADRDGSALESVGDALEVERDPGGRHRIEGSGSADRSGEEELDLDAVSRLRRKLNVGEIHSCNLCRADGQTEQGRIPEHPS